ncbi:restriction endonuclease subunit S [Limosilactobacillus reuteri]
MADIKRKVPNLRFKGFTDDWEQRKLGGLFSTITDYVANGSFKSLRDHVKTYDTPNYAYMIRLIDASNDWKGPWLYTDRNGYSFLRKTSLKTNDVLLSNVGAGVGKTFLVPNLDKPMTLAPNSVLLRSSLFNERYLFYLINTCKNKNKILSMVGISAQPKLNKTDFKEVKVNTSLQKQEQLKIEETLSLIENNITLQQRKLDLLKQLKKGLLQKMFADKDSKQPILRFKGFHDDWEQRKLGEVFLYKQGIQVPVEQQYSQKLPGLIRFIRISDIVSSNEPPRFINYHGTNLIKPDDLFMVRYGNPGMISMGYSGVIANNLFRLIPKKNIYTLFFYFLLIFENKRLNSLVSNTTMPALSFKALDTFYVNFPEKLSEQKVIGSLLKKLDSLITLQQRRLTKLNTIKKSLLQQMFI